jgi:DNA-binding CsgD family transcriptional regulator
MKIDNSQTAACKSARRAKSPHSEDQLHKTISNIYDAAVDSRLWPKALAEILRYVGNSGTHLWLMNGKTSEVTHSIHVGMPDKMIEEYNGDVIKECPRWANARRHPHRTFLFDYQHIDERQIDSNEYYHWLQSKGDQIRYYLGGRLRLGNSLDGFQSLAFRKKEGHSQKKHLERFSQILPHVQHAIQIGQRLGTWHFAARSALEALDKLAQGVVIFDESGKYIAVNWCAERLLRPPYRIALTGNRLKAFDAAANQQLQVLIGRCAATTAGNGKFEGGTVKIPADLQAAPLNLHVYPLKLPLESFNGSRSAVAVFFKDPMQANAIDDAALKATFGLTAAERRLTMLLLQGTTMKEASKTLEVSPNTAQSQLKSIFSKVGVHRQAELIRVLLPLVTSCKSI